MMTMFLGRLWASFFLRILHRQSYLLFVGDVFEKQIAAQEPDGLEISQSIRFLKI